jgi:hypothetical protein
MTLQQTIIGDDGFECLTHGKFYVTDSVIRKMRDRTRGEWEGALTRAKHRIGAQGGPPCVLCTIL